LTHVKLAPLLNIVETKPIIITFAHTDCQLIKSWHLKLIYLLQ